MKGREIVRPPYPATFIGINKNSPGATCKKCIFPAGISKACTSCFTNKRQKTDDRIIAIRLLRILWRSSSKWPTKGISSARDASFGLALTPIFIGGGAFKVFSFWLGLASLI